MSIKPREQPEWSPCIRIRFEHSSRNRRALLKALRGGVGLRRMRRRRIRLHRQRGGSTTAATHSRPAAAVHARHDDVGRGRRGGEGRVGAAETGTSWNLAAVGVREQVRPRSASLNRHRAIG